MPRANPVSALRRAARTAIILLGINSLAPVAPARAAPDPAAFADNADAVAVVIGNRSYKQTVPVDYAHNDAEAIRAYLIERLGYREGNVFLLKDATLNEFNQVFGTERNPQSGRLWRSVREGRSNVFVYYSGHGVPDLTTKQPFLLPEDGNPNQGESGYSLETLYRNLELVKRKIGPDHQLVVMVDACFTGETGRKGESLLAVSAPGFAPARPKAEGGIVRLVATSGATPANWDEANRLGLLTSRFLMGVSGLADARDQQGDGDGLVQWTELKLYLRREVEDAARRASGREQVPEIDEAPIVLKASLPVAAVAQGVAAIRDEAAWRRAETLGTREAFEVYIGACGETCLYRPQAMDKLLAGRRRDAAAIDQENWARFGTQRQYQAYLDSCGEVCAYRSLAEGYLGGKNPSADPRVKRCDELASRHGRSRSSEWGHRREARPDRAGSRDRRLPRGCGRLSGPAPPLLSARPHLRPGRPLQGGLRRLRPRCQGRERVGAEQPRRPLRERPGREAPAGRGVPSLSAGGRRRECGRAGQRRPDAGIRQRHPEGRGAGGRPVSPRRGRGDVASISKLVPHYATGAYGFPKDLRQGFNLFRQAADRGDPVAMATMATLIDNGFGRYFPGVRSADMVMRALKHGELGAASVSATDTAAQKLKPETIRSVQRAIKDADYYTGALDGRFNPVFVRALDQYARANETE